MRSQQDKCDLRGAAHVAPAFAPIATPTNSDTLRLPKTSVRHSNSTESTKEEPKEGSVEKTNWSPHCDNHPETQCREIRSQYKVTCRSFACNIEQAQEHPQLQLRALRPLLQLCAAECFPSTAKIRAECKLQPTQHSTKHNDATDTGSLVDPIQLLYYSVSEILTSLPFSLEFFTLINLGVGILLLFLTKPMLLFGIVPEGISLKSVSFRPENFDPESP